MKRKNYALRVLSMLLSLILLLSVVPAAGILSASAGAEEGIYLRGNMNGWNCYEQYKFVDEGNGIYTLILSLTGGNYEYKIGTPSWSVGLGDPKNNSANAHLVIEGDSIVKFTANLNTYKQSTELMNTKSDFTLNASTATTIEAEKYTFALGALSLLSDSKASGGKYVGDFDAGDSLNYGVTVSGTNAVTYKFSLNVASAADNGQFNFITGTESTPAAFGSTGNWQTYKTLVFTKTLNPGYNRITIDNIEGTYNVDKIVVQPVTDYANAIVKGETTVDFSNYASAYDTNIVKDGAITDAKAGDVVSVIVKPEQDGVYVVSLAGGTGTKTLILGDADLDNVVNIKDATLIQKATAEIESLSSDAELAADVDGSEDVNIKDATAIQKSVAAIDTGLDIGISFTVAGSGEAAKGEVAIGTSIDDLSDLGEDCTSATLVIDGETEVFVYANSDGVSLSGLTFEYISNVELMGYTMFAEKLFGYRFATDFIIDEVKIYAYDDHAAGTLCLSNGSKYDIPALKSDDVYTFKLPEPQTVTYVAYTNETEVCVDLAVLGTKDAADTTKDIIFEGYASTSAGWQVAECYAYDELTAKSFGIGFNKEATVDKVSFISLTDEIPDTVKVTTASGETKTLTGTVSKNDVQNMCTFDLGGLYSFGFFFEFDKEVTVNMIAAEGNTEYKGASTNISDAWDYELFANGLTENDSRAVANDGYTITSSETGSDRVWNLTEDISGAPSFYAPNSPMAEAAYNLTMEEIYKSINYDETFGDVFYTGTNWHKVWTRDTAISMQYILSWLFPEISTNCANAKVVGKDGYLTFEEDTGTGGSYPVSTDRIIMMLAVWETYLADGNLENLEYFYNVASNTIMQDYEVVYDDEAGLFRGETCGLDHRDKTYGDWTGEDDENGIVTIAEGKAASTNIIFCQAMKILSEAATILGKDEAEAKAWADLATELEEAIAARLWHDELGTYSSWEYPDWMGSPLAYKQDVLANGYAVWYNIGGQEKSDSIMENHTLVNFGANTVYPQKNAERWTDYKYHDSGVWPGWEAILMIGAVNNANENNLLAEEIWNSCIRGAVSCLTNYEVIDYETGEGLHSTQQLWSVAATMAGYYRVLFGMEYTTEGITFDPYVPQWMEGPFYISGLNYRDAYVNLELYGKGDTVESIFVNGEQVANDYVLPADAEGDYDIIINVTDSGAEDVINLKDENTAKAPTAPNATLTGTTLKWNAVANCTYKVWTGSEYVDVTGTTYTIDADKYGAYSVVAVDKTTGIWSEISKPITVSPAGSNITVNVGNHTDNFSNPKPVTFSVDIPVDGVYQLSAIHTNQGDPTAGVTAAIRSVYVDGEEVGTLVFPSMSFGHQISSHLRLSLTAGKHEVTVKYDTENWYDRNMSQASLGQKNNNVTYHMFQFTLTDGDFSQIEPPAKKTVYFTNNQNWSTVKIFFWGGSDTTEWSGEEMTYVGKNEHGQDIYSYELDPSTPNIIFNNGSEQTVDITTGVEDNAGFYLDKKVDGKWTVGTWTYEG